MSFSNNLRKLIDENELTQKELARHLNIAPSTLGSYVQGVREPDFSTLKSLADYFKVSTDYLLDHSISPNISYQERELLRVFRSLTESQQYICIEQCKVFMKTNLKSEEKNRKSS